MGEAMVDAGFTLTDGAVVPSEPPVVDMNAGARFRALIDAQYDFVWRSLRRLGVASGDVDDSAQLVFLTAARKLGSILVGRERSFLFQTALRVAADSRRARRRRPEIASNEEPTDEIPAGEDLLDLHRARKQLDEILDRLPMGLRSVFVLYELDEMTMGEIAVLLDIPAGTVASRLRRARTEFRLKAAKLARDQERSGGER